MAKKNHPVHLIVFLCFTLLALLNARLLWSVKDRVLEGYGDFAHFYAAALIVRSGDGERLYDYEEQRKIQQSLFSHVETRPEPLIFNHLSYETLVWLPLTFFGYAKAVVVWIVINLILLLAISAILSRHLPAGRAALRLPLMVCLFACFPILLVLIQGQDSILLLLCYSIAFVLLKQEKDWPAGLVLSLAMFKFHLILPFVALLFVQRNWKFVLGFFTGSIVPLVLSIWISGISGLLQFIRFLVRSNQSGSTLDQFGLYPNNMPNLRGMLVILLGDHISDRLLFIITAAVSLIVFGLVARSSRELALDERIGAAIIATLLISYHLFTYDLTIATLPALLFVNRLA